VPTQRNPRGYRQGNSQGHLPLIPAELRPRKSKTAAGASREYREAREQAALFEYLRLPHVAALHPAIPAIHASLNGVHLTPAQAAKAKAGGMVPGVWDVLVPAYTGEEEETDSGTFWRDNAGLYVEMKDPARRNCRDRESLLSEEQKEFRKAVGGVHRWFIACTWCEAAEEILSYLGVLTPEIAAELAGKTKPMMTTEVV
jgi:hypothetical protein